MTKVKDKIEKLGGKCITDDDDNVIFSEIDLTYTYENKFDYTDKEIKKLRNQEKKDKKRYKIKETFDIVDWDRVNNLTNEEVDIVHDLLKDIK